MAEWLESNFLKRWYWREVWSNFREWLRDAPVVVQSLFWVTMGLLGWLLFVEHFSAAVEQVATPESVVRGTGVFLQLSGFLVAAYGLEKTLEEFGRTPSTSRILPWVKKLLSIFDTTVRGSMELEGKAGAFDAFGATVKRGLHLPETTAERIRKLEKAVEDLRDEIGEVREEVEREAERLESKIEEEVEAVEQDIRDVREKMKEVNVGELTLRLEWVGVSLLIYGVLLSSFPSLFLSAETILLVPVAIVPPLLLLNSM